MQLTDMLFAPCVAIGAAFLVFLGTSQMRTLRPVPIVVLAIVSAALLPALLFARPQSLVIANVVNLAAAVGVGAGLGLLISSTPALVSFAVVAGIVDLYSATRGVTARISDAYEAGSSNLMLLLSVSYRFGERVQQVIGVGDLIILAVFFFSLDRLGYRPWQTFAAPAAGLTVALIAGIALGGAPAIPLIAAATICLVAFVRPAA